MPQKKEQREIYSHMLARLGYSVQMVNSGEKAVDFSQYDKVDLLKLDMTMPPGVDGVETYRQIIHLGGTAVDYPQLSIPHLHPAHCW